MILLYTLPGIFNKLILIFTFVSYSFVQYTEIANTFVQSLLTSLSLQAKLHMKCIQARFSMKRQYTSTPSLPKAMFDITHRLKLPSFGTQSYHFVTFIP